jgi:PAS domain S-box-containing protein
MRELVRGDSRTSIPPGMKDWTPGLTAGRLRSTELPGGEAEDFFENSPVAFRLVAQDGTILRANRAELAMLGYGEAEYVGRNIAEFHADAETVQDIMARLARGETLDKRPARMLAKDGSIKHVLIASSAHFRDGKFVNSRCMSLDVTEWKLNEKTLWEQDERLKATYERANIGIVEVDAKGNRMRVNRTACDITGYTREELLNGNIFDVLYSGDREEDLRQYRRLVAGEIDQYSIEKRIARKDGALVWVAITCSAVRDAAGKFLYAVRIFHDVTAAKVMTRVLAESEQRLAATYEHAAIGISEVDGQGRLLRVNETTCRVTGYSRKELLGRTIFDITHPDDRDGDRGAFQCQPSDPARRYTVEKRLIRKNGSVIWVSVTSSTISDAAGNFLYAIRVMQDITERKRAEELLRESERQLRELLEAMPVAVYTTDAEGRVTFYNEAAVALAGREPVLGSDRWCVSWRLYWPDGTPMPHADCPMAVALRENRSVRGVEAVVERPDGARVPFIPYPTPIHDPSGALAGAINVLVDISERKQAEGHQKILLDELNHRVKNNMQMLHALLRGAYRETSSVEARAVLADASQRVAAMAAAQQVLYDAGNAARYSAGDFLQAVCASARQAFGVVVDISIAECAGAELANDTVIPLALILNELLTNAVKHGVNAPGGGLIKVGLTKNYDGFVLYVEDEGPGFDFERAQRRSSGLGLVSGLVQQLRGTFQVERTGGARCVVRFPAIE